MKKSKKLMFRIEPDLYDFLKRYTVLHGVTMTQVLTDYIQGLRDQSEPVISEPPIDLTERLSL